MSIIRDQVEAYIAYKNGLGVLMTSEASAMRQFARYTDSVGYEGPITVEIAVEWARSGAGHAEGYEIKRNEMARRVHEYACALAGAPATLPPGLIGKSCNRTTPYIFTDEEISLVMHAASRLYVQQDAMRPLAYAAVMGLLRATGMRPNEVLLLNDSDLDPEAAVFTVRKGKNDRERLLPVDESAVDAITRYRKRRDELRDGGGAAKSSSSSTATIRFTFTTSSTLSARSDASCSTGARFGSEGLLEYTMCVIPSR